MIKKTHRFFCDTSGAAAIEYALIIALISVAIIASLQQIGTRLSETLNIISNRL
jgi:Flp pilus assembly pilin Flp